MADPFGFVAAAQAFSTILWSLVGVLGAGVVVWFIWQILQIGRDFRFYLKDYVGYERGRIKRAADKRHIEIVVETKPASKTRRGKFDVDADEAVKDDEYAELPKQLAKKKK